MYFRIAIVDDNQTFIEYAVNTLNELSDLYIDAYLNSKSFIEALENGKTFDLVFIDYEMPDCNGLSLADLAQLKTALFVLTTSYASLTLSKQCFQHDVFRYITKDMFKSEAFEAIAHARTLLNDSEIKIKVKKCEFALKLSDIYSVYSIEHYLYFLLENKEYRTRMSTNDVKKQLLENDFVCASYNVYVNVYKIKRIEKYSVTLKNGKHHKISRTKFASLSRRYAEVI